MFNCGKYEEAVEKAAKRCRGMLRMPLCSFEQCEGRDHTRSAGGVLLPTAPTTRPPCSNRAAAWIKLGRGKEAAADAEATLRLRPGWDKAAFRLGCSLELLGRPDDVMQRRGAC